MKLTVVGRSPAWPNPGGAQSGYLLEGPGRLRSTAVRVCSPVCERVTARTGGPRWTRSPSRTSTSTIGAISSRGCGEPCGASVRTRSAPSSGCHQAGARKSRRSAPVWDPDMFVRAFELMEYVEGEPFEAAGLELTAMRLPHYTVQTFGFRVSNSSRTLGPTRRLRPERKAGQARRGGRSLPVRGDAQGRCVGRPAAGPTSADEAVSAFEASGAKRLVLTHRPEELGNVAGVEQAARRPRARRLASAWLDSRAWRGGSRASCGRRRRSAPG